MFRTEHLSSTLPPVNPTLLLAAYCFSAMVAFAGDTALTSRTNPAPTISWPVAVPEEVGVDSAALCELLEHVRAHQTPVHSILLVRHGRLAFEAYFHPYRAGMRHDIASVTKSITSTLVGVAIKRGYLRDVHQPVLSLFTGHAAQAEPRKGALTLEHLLTMQAGWDCGVKMDDPRINVDARLAEMRATSDWVRYALELPMVDPPGAVFRYCNVNCHLLSTLLTQQTGSNALALARRELFEPLGIHDVVWPADPKGNNHGWGDLQLHPRDMARLGQLFLQRGRWGERQLVAEGWMRDATRSHVKVTGNNDQYGYFWWMPGERFPGLFEAIGRGGQRITVWPARDLVLVYTGGGFNTDELTPFILRSLRSDGALPQNAGAAVRLRDQLAEAVRPPAPKPVAARPALAAEISGKTYALTRNSLEFATLRLRFDKTNEASVHFTRHGQDLRCPVGLDGVERHSADTLIELPVAAKGQWESQNTFMLFLDRVGGVDFYRFQLTFSDAGRAVAVTLSERTGLVGESFQGNTKR
jgi:CubicO group peptidase (beta-lactamase class C family)